VVAVEKKNSPIHVSQENIHRSWWRINFDVRFDIN